MKSLVRSLKQLLLRYLNELLFIVCFLLNFVLLFVFIMIRGSFYYFIAITLVVWGIYHLVKNKNDKVLRLFYVSAILIFMLFIFIVYNFCR